MTDTRSRRLEMIGNALMMVLAMALAVAYGIDMANRTEARLSARAERAAR